MSEARDAGSASMASSSSREGRLPRRSRLARASQACGDRGTIGSTTSVSAGGSAGLSGTSTLGASRWSCACMRRAAGRTRAGSALSSWAALTGGEVGYLADPCRRRRSCRTHRKCRRCRHRRGRRTSCHRRLGRRCRREVDVQGSSDASLPIASSVAHTAVMPCSGSGSWCREPGSACTRRADAGPGSWARCRGRARCRSGWGVDGAAQLKLADGQLACGGGEVVVGACHGTVWLGCSRRHGEVALDLIELDRVGPVIEPPAQVVSRPARLVSTRSSHPFTTSTSCRSSGGCWPQSPFHGGLGHLEPVWALGALLGSNASTVAVPGRSRGRAPRAKVRSAASTARSWPPRGVAARRCRQVAVDVVGSRVGVDAVESAGSGSGDGIAGGCDEAQQRRHAYVGGAHAGSSSRKRGRIPHPSGGRMSVEVRPGHDEAGSRSWRWTNDGPRRG